MLAQIMIPLVVIVVMAIPWTPSVKEAVGRPPLVDRSKEDSDG